MGFWTGVAKGLEQDNERRFQAEQAEGDRAFQRELLQSRLEADRQQTLLQARLDRENTILQLGLGGSRRGSTGSGGSSGGGDSVPLAALLKRFPTLSPEAVSGLAPYPDKITEVYNKLSEAQQKYADEGRMFPAERLNEFITDVVDEEFGEITSEKINETARMYGLDPEAEAAPGMTWGSVFEQALTPEPNPEVIYNPSALPEPLSPERERAFKEGVNSQVQGFLSQQVRELTTSLGQFSDRVVRGEELTAEEKQQYDDGMAQKEEVQALIDQIAAGYGDQALSSPYGTEVMLNLWNTGSRVDYRQIFPGFTPTFPAGEAGMAMVQAAFESGFIQLGQRIKVGNEVFEVE